jgi:hypothetical protein
MDFVGVSAIFCTMLEWLCCIVGPMWVEISFKTTIKHNPTMVGGSRLIVRTRSCTTTCVSIASNLQIPTKHTSLKFYVFGFDL